MPHFFDSILNQFRDEDHEGIDEPEPSKTLIVRQPPLFVTQKVDVPRLYSTLRAVENTALDAEFELLVLTGRVDSLTVDQEVQNTAIMALDGAFANVAADNEIQDESIAALETENNTQSEDIASLQSGFLPRVYYALEGLGGAQIVIEAGQPFTDMTTGLDGVTPSTLQLQTYDAINTVGSYANFEGDLITLGPDVKVDGTLILNEKSVADQLLDIEDKLSQYGIELATNFAADALQQALLAAIAAYAARPPAGYEALPDDIGGDDDDDNKSIRLNPLRLYPTGTFNQGLDSLGNQIGVPETVTKGKVSINLNELCTRTLHLKGDILQEVQDLDDEVEFQSTCRLGSKVGRYNAENVLQNPNGVVCRLGTNILATVDGTLDCAAVKAERVVCNNINGLSTSKLLHIAKGPTADFSRAISRQGQRITALQRLAQSSRVQMPSRDFTEDVVRIRNELTYLERLAQSGRVQMPSKDFTEDVVRIRNELTYLEKLAQAKVQMPVIDMTRQVASRVNAVTRRIKPSLAVGDYRPSIKRVSARISAIQKLIKPQLTKVYDRQIASLRSAVVFLNRRRPPLQLTAEVRPALKRLSDRIVVTRRNIKPFLSRSYDTAVVRLSSRISSAVLSLSSSLSGVRSSVKPVLARSYDAVITRISNRVSAMTNYTAALATSTTNNTNITSLFTTVKDLNVNNIVLGGTIRGVVTPNFSPIGDNIWVKVGYVLSTINYFGKISIDTDYEVITIDLQLRGDSTLALGQPITIRKNVMSPISGLVRNPITAISISNLGRDINNQTGHIYVQMSANATYSLDVNYLTHKGVFITETAVQSNTSETTNVTLFPITAQEIHYGSTRFEKALTASNGLTVTSGGVSVLDASLSFNDRFGEHIKLNGSTHAIGSQQAIIYFRSTGGLACYSGGSFASGQGDAGPNGTLIWFVGGDGTMYSKGANNTTTNVLRSDKTVFRSGTANAASNFTGTVSFGIVYSAVPIVTLTLQDSSNSYATLSAVSTSGFQWTTTGVGAAGRLLHWHAHGNAG
jgi:hypothetical protein